MHQSKRSLYIFLLLTQALLFLVYGVVYFTLTDIFDFGQHLALTKVLFFVLSYSFLIASFVSHHVYNSFSKAFYTCSAFILGFLFYFFFASIIYLIGALSIVHFGVPISEITWGIYVFGFTLFIIFYGIINAHVIRVVRHEVTLPNLPMDWQGRKMLFVSDLHLGQVRGEAFAKKIVTKINSLSPDIVCIGGDLFDGVRVHASEMISSLSGLHPKLGTYFVTGNHEYMGQSTHYISAIELLGIKVLKDEVVDIDGLQLIGVDYRDSTEGAAYDALFTLLAINKDKPSILLKHTPFHIEIAEKHGVNLQLSGHTHHAQMFPGNLITKRLFKGFDYGLKKWKNMAVYTSSGVGTWGPPIRVGTKSEIVLLKFKN